MKNRVKTIIKTALVFGLFSACLSRISLVEADDYMTVVDLARMSQSSFAVSPDVEAIMMQNTGMINPVMLGEFLSLLQPNTSMATFWDSSLYVLGMIGDIFELVLTIVL